MLDKLGKAELGEATKAMGLVFAIGLVLAVIGGTLNVMISNDTTEYSDAEIPKEGDDTAVDATKMIGYFHQTGKGVVGLLAFWFPIVGMILIAVGIGTLSTRLSVLCMLAAPLGIFCAAFGAPRYRNDIRCGNTVCACSMRRCKEHDLLGNVPRAREESCDCVPLQKNWNGKSAGHILYSVCGSHRIGVSAARRGVRGACSDGISSCSGISCKYRAVPRQKEKNDGSSNNNNNNTQTTQLRHCMTLR